MATILEFRRVAEVPAAARRSRRRRRSAEIVIFPGVRYERLTDAAPRQSSPRSKTKPVAHDRRD